MPPDAFMNINVCIFLLFLENLFRIRAPIFHIPNKIANAAIRNTVHDIFQAVLYFLYIIPFHVKV